MPIPHNSPNQLLPLICEQIDTKGPITLADYMQLALYHPRYGYYQNGQMIFGKKGDYITAPLISPLFSQCLAERCASRLKTCDQGCVLELGAGTGQMAYDILLELEKMDCLPATYFILEPSAFLQHQQRETLKHLPSKLHSRVHWLHSLPDDNSFQGVIIANEVIDAMPVHGFKAKDNKIEELYITHKNQTLESVYLPCNNQALLDTVTKLPLDPSVCYHSEVNLWIQGWLNSLYACMQLGDIIFIDYGFLDTEYYHPDRANGTLRCFYQHHRVDDYLTRPGQQDITADVNFTQLGNNALTAGFSVTSYQTQTHFLIQHHITDRLAAITDKDDYDHAARAVKQLTLPSELGERFKVMTIEKNLKNVTPA